MISTQSSPRPSPKALTRRTVIATLATVTTGALAACGTPTNREARTETAPAATKPTGNIEFWHNWSTRAPQLRIYLDRFEQENPGAKVLDQDATQQGGRAKMTANIVAGTAPDSLMVFKDMYALVVPAKAMIGLNKYVARDKIDLKQFGEADIKDRTFGGELVVLPSASGVTANAITVFWNKDHFRQAGLNAETGPKNWTELEQFATRLTRAGDRIGVQPAGRFLPWLYVNGGSMYSDADGRKLNFESAEARDALRYTAQLVQRQGGGNDPLFDKSGQDNRAYFFQGKHSMLLEGDLLPSILMADTLGKEIQWGVAQLPVNDRNSKAKYVVPSRGGHGYGVTAQAKNPEAAWALAKFLTLSDAQCDFMIKDQGRPSTLKRCNTSPDALKHPHFQLFSRLVNDVISLPFSPGDDRAVAALERHAFAAMQGKVSVDEALKLAQQEGQNEIDEGWKTWRA